MLKNERGITLVALVVTIIILIILATISLSAALGSDGLINQAKDAANRQKDAEQEYANFQDAVMTQVNEALKTD